jgi:TrmH family RNA methyltransferase
MRRVSSRQNPIVRTFRELAAAPPADGSRLLLDGVHLVRDARAAGLPFEHVAVSSRHVGNGSEVAAMADVLSRDGIDVVSVTEPVMGAISPVRTPSGIVAITVRRPVTVDDICRHPRAFVVGAIDVQDPGNLGALVRAAEAGGVTGVAVSGASAQPFSWKAVRGSMGSLLRLPVAIAPTPDVLLESARRSGLKAIAAVPRGGSAPEAVDWRGRAVLLVGGEGPGLSDDLVAACDARVTVPMQQPVESLNVAVAAAILVYEARRQRL